MNLKDKLVRGVLIYAEHCTYQSLIALFQLLTQTHCLTTSEYKSRQSGKVQTASVWVIVKGLSEYFRNYKKAISLQIIVRKGFFIRFFAL